MKPHFTPKHGGYQCSITLGDATVRAWGPNVREAWRRVFRKMLLALPVVASFGDSGGGEFE